MEFEHIISATSNSVYMGNMGGICAPLRRSKWYTYWRTKKMSDLTINSLKIKIDIVKTDIERLQSEGENIRKVETLTEYKKYLEDSLNALENNNS
jgi:hypothetical protein